MLTLQLMNSSQPDNEITLFDGLTLGPKTASFPLPDCKDSAPFVVTCDAQGNFIIKSPPKSEGLTQGDEKLTKLVLMPGIFFSVSSHLFSVQENSNALPHKTSSSDNTGLSLSDAFLSLTPDRQVQKAFPSFLKTPVEFEFIRGPLLGTKWELSLLPSSFGTHSLLYFFQEPELTSHTQDFLTLSLNDSGFFLETTLPQKVRFNSKPLFSKHPLSHRDFVELPQSAFYILLP